MFEDDLLAWHDGHARDLPWRGETDPYRIWISEIMLQQTRTETVAGYYRSFLEAFPDVFCLASASEEQVFKRWEGLGYYSRARNLHRAAKQIVSEFGGKLPDTAEGLLCLPGVGDYTAGAIASIAFHRKELAMDGNAVRVLSRVTGERRCVGKAEVRRQLKAAGTALMTDKRPGDFNQAMMGLGNLICVPVHPKCENCPVRTCCRAEQEGVQAELPVLPPRQEKRKLSVGVALVFDEDRVLLVRRPNEGLLAGLWAFPAFEGARNEGDVREALEEMGIKAKKGERLSDAEHIFTHRVWKMKGWQYKTSQGIENEDVRMVNLDGLNQAAIPTAFRIYREIAASILTKRKTEEA